MVWRIFCIFAAESAKMVIISRICLGDEPLAAGYFGDLIRKETGLTAQRYIQNKVIDLSKQYVMDHELTINQVAYKLGFRYPQHFTRLFKQQVGVTPSEYRN